MTYGEVRDAALQLINQYSIAGDNIPATYNNQQDYLSRIPFLVDDAQMYVATVGKRIPAYVSVSDLEYTEVGPFRRYQMPEDFFQFKGLSMMVYGRYETRRIPFERTDSPNTFLVRGESFGLEDALVGYYRYPARVGSNPADDTPLDNTPDAQQILPYYVASHLVMQDDAYQQASLYNEFETRMSRLGTPVTVEQDRIVDAYAFDMTSPFLGR